MGTIYKAIITFVFVFIFTMPSIVCQAQETDADCIRKYFMGKCENKALQEDFEERGEIYVTEEAMFSIIRTNIPSVLHHDRFVMIQPSFAIKSTIEYFFEATYDCARDPVIREREIQDGDTIEEELYPSYLNLRLYFDGDQKELVKEWTVNSPIHLFGTLTNRMFEYETSLLRTEVPITNLLDEFEKKPVSCQVKPEKDDIDTGEEIEIVFSDFRDAEQRASREFNRIVVHANEGKILNGETSVAGPEYKVFCLNEQPVKVRYEAPENSETGSDRITVYNSCEILPPDRAPLRTTNPDKQIASHVLRIKHNDWSGNLSFHWSTTFECTYNGTEIEKREQNIELSLSIESIEFPGIPNAKIKNVQGTGNIVVSYLYKHESQGGENYSLSRVNGNNNCPVSEKCLATMLIQKKMSEDPKAMRKRIEELATTDPLTLKKEIQAMYNLDDKNEIPIEILITTGATCIGALNVESISKSKDGTKSYSKTEETNLARPITVLLSGTMKLNSDGTGTINASNVGTEETPNGTISDFNCPPIIIKTNCHLNLEKRKAN